jgi:RNA polymerase sigma factor (sigma-70 family)
LTPSRILAQGEAVAALLRRLDELPEQYREAILLAKVAGWSTREVGELLGKSPEGAALLLHRALKRLRELDQSPPKTA